MLESKPLKPKLFIGGLGAIIVIELIVILIIIKLIVIIVILIIVIELIVIIGESTVPRWRWRQAPSVVPRS